VAVSRSSSTIRIRIDVSSASRAGKRRSCKLLPPEAFDEYASAWAFVSLVQLLAWHTNPGSELNTTGKRRATGIAR
jgi:hypothetical protein